jgi:hypothetical protein
VSEPANVPPHWSQRADAGVGARNSTDPAAGGADAGSQRVQELPPPPRIVDQLRPLSGAIGVQPAALAPWWSRVRRRRWFSCTVSLVFHFGLLMALGLLFQASLPGSNAAGLIAYSDSPVPLDSAVGEYHPGTLVLAKPVQTGAEATALGWAEEVPQLADLGRRPSHPADLPNLPPAPFGMQLHEPADWLLRSDAEVSGALRGRGREGRALLAKRDGGTAESERAVEWGLRWLMAHQLDDGSWDFDHNKSACRGQCRNPGTEASTTAATAIALLPFLGAGYTQVEGQYQEAVQRGIYHLVKRARLTPHGADLQEGTMYAQGLSAIALCEAYAMTRDPTLKDLAQGAIRFIVYAQDPKGGGWRYVPGQPGDTTVTGWQLMALKSGQMAQLEVPRPALYLAQRFLSSVESEGGARYGYLTPQPRNTTTAIGLLCRMYTGWRRDHPGLQKGVAYLSRWGPSPDNMYYNYYATQVMHHWGGTEWEKWNRRMRDYLIATQAKSSHEAGSWYFSGGYGEVGGRLYNTAMAVMTLEVYYRYMPLYREAAVAGKF